MVKGVTELYQPLHQAAPKDGVTVVKDMAYCDGERQRLDLYIPQKLPANGKPPIIVFAHGGGFVRGDKADVAHFGYYFARQGIVTVLIDYGFAPKAKFPAGARIWARPSSGCASIRTSNRVIFLDLRFRKFCGGNPCGDLWLHDLGRQA